MKTVQKSVRRPKNRSNKIVLVFDEKKRRDFLTGFHKRKLQRQKKAQEELAQQLKEERKRLKNEAKESYKKLVVSHRPIPEVENLLREEYEDDDVTVKVVELSTNEIAEQNNWIGANRPKYETDDEEVDETPADIKTEEDEVPGMEMKKKVSTVKAEKQTFQSERDLKKVLKKKATKEVKKSKVFQTKNRIERQKQKKKSLKEKKKKENFFKKKNKNKIRKH